MKPTTLYIDGVALWAPALPGWAQARAAFRGEAAPVIVEVKRPAPQMLATNERRRAPDTVLLALEVAAAATAMSGHNAAMLASVFTSAHGDLPITDTLCRTLAEQPLALSPTRFHHSVHNAASGYWAIGSGSHAASTALAAGAHSFAAGLLEAACQCAADNAPVLLAGHDTEAVGPLTSVNRSRGLLAVALVLSPRRGAASRWAVSWNLRWNLQANLQADLTAGLTAGLQAGLQAGLLVESKAPALRSTAAHSLADNAMAHALPLFEALAAEQPHTLALPMSTTQHLALAITPLFETAACAQPRGAGA